jgi:serine/threonine-protein kinase
MFVCPECGASSPVPGPCPADRHQLAPVGDDALLGTTVGAYRVARLLGVGGMGRVYKGVHPQIGSRVAIKVLSRECSERRDLVDRFFSEARAVNLIRHESIVNVLDLAHLPDGRPFIIMEYLDGQPLSSAIEAVPHVGPLPLGSVARLVVEVLDALGAAHATGIVHRDLKPDNLFVAPSGRPKILDFGIAKLLPELGGTYTQTGSLLGTPHYMSPEQASGRPVDYRADIYAMGVILFECVTGTKPFHGDSLFDLLRKQVDAPPPPPSQLRPGMPPAYEQVILAALAKTPEQRWQSAQQMGQALQQATAALPPEQWGPLPSPGASSSGGRPASGAGWDATGGRWSHTPHGSVPGQPTPGSYPGAPPVASYPGAPGSYPGAPAHPTTVSGASAMVGVAGKKPNSALWIAVAVLVAGGGITTAIVASRGGGGGPPIAAGGGPTPSGPLTIPAGQGMQIAGGGGGVQVRPSVPNNNGSLVSYRTLDVPDWDPKHVDLDSFIAYARQRAKQAVPDAELNRFDGANVYPDGHVDMTMANSYIVVRFMSPSHAKPDPSVPVGGQQQWHCMFQIMATTQTGPILVPADSVSCEKEAPQPMKCSPRQVWQQMIGKGAPSGNAVAQIDYFSAELGKPAGWFTVVGDKYHGIFDDHCQ